MISLNNSTPQTVYIMGYLMGTENEWKRDRAGKVIIKDKIPENTPCVIIEKGTEQAGQYNNIFVRIEMLEYFGCKESDHIIAVSEKSKTAVDKYNITFNEKVNQAVSGTRRSVLKRFYTTALGKTFLMFNNK